MSSQHRPFLALLGPPAAFLPNCFSLAIAFAMAIEVQCCRYAQLGSFQPGDALMCFVPLLAILLVRKPAFSRVFLLLYAVVAIPLFVAVWQIAFGIDRFGRPSSSPLLMLGIFAGLSAACLAIYTAGFLVVRDQKRGC